VADEPVVVLKIRPEKAREGVEGKTGLTRDVFAGTVDSQKRRLDVKGGSLLESFVDGRDAVLRR
jgi:hypothetical protein